MSGLYVDTSALVKTLVPEAESAALVAVLDATSPLLTSEVASTELRRVARWSGIATERVQRRLAQLDRLPATREVLVSAGELPDPVEPPGTRLGSLDAIHLASALRAGADRFVTYDRNRSRAARAAGLTVLHPGRPADWFVQHQVGALEAHSVPVRSDGDELEGVAEGAAGAAQVGRAVSTTSASVTCSPGSPPSGPAAADVDDVGARVPGAAGGGGGQPPGTPG